MKQCYCCAAFARHLVGVGNKDTDTFMHLGCWQEHHSDPSGAWPRDHVCTQAIYEEMVAKASQVDIIGERHRDGQWVLAEHCPGCGRWAHVESGNDMYQEHYWIVTNCKKCGRYETRGAPLFWRHHEGRTVTVEKLEG